MAMNYLLVQFSYLQLLDFLTTVAFLLVGVQEANPLVKLAFQLGPSPVAGLALVKLLGVGMGFYCYRQGRQSLLVKMNVFFAALVAWNLFALILGNASTLHN